MCRPCSPRGTGGSWRTGSRRPRPALRLRRPSERIDGRRDDLVDALTPHRDASPTEHGFLSFFDTPDGDVGMVWLDGRQTPRRRGAPKAQHGHGGGAGCAPQRSTPCGAAPRAPTCSSMLASVIVARRRPSARARGAGRLPRSFGDRGAGHQRRAVRQRHSGNLAARCTPMAGRFGVPGQRARAGVIGRHRGDCLVHRRRQRGAHARWRSRVTAAPRSVSRFASTTAMPLGRVDVELLPDGSAVVVWIESSQGHADVRARRVFADGRRGPSAVVARVGQTVRAATPV